MGCLWVDLGWGSFAWFNRGVGAEEAANRQQRTSKHSSSMTTLLTAVHSHVQLCLVLCDHKDKPGGGEKAVVVATAKD